MKNKTVCVQASPLHMPKAVARGLTLIEAQQRANAMVKEYEQQGYHAIQADVYPFRRVLEHSDTQEQIAIFVSEAGVW